MTMFPRFAYPWFLCLLLLVPWSIWLGAKIRSLPTGRKWIAVVLRALILLCLIGALAGTELVRTNDRLAVFFLMDWSNSIPEQMRSASIQSVNAICEQYMTSRDEAGVIVFGEESSIELSVDPVIEFDKVESLVGGEQTDVAAAVRLASAAFPQGYMRRIVLFTDGNETQGSAIEEIKLAHASGIAVDVMPIDIAGANEVRIREVVAPNRVNADEPFKLKAVVHSDQDCPATLRVYQRTRSGKQLLQTAPVTLQQGDNAFLLPQNLNTPGFYEYEATIEAESDTIMANNEGRAFTQIRGEPTVLYADSEPGKSIYLEPALAKEGIRVERVDLGGIPTSLAGFQNYDAVVLANVSATDLSSDQLKLLEAMVRDLGVGLVMIGGNESFGAGGYYDTAVERALPISMDLKQRKIMPRGALVLIMHTCEIPDGNAWARDIGIAALNVLSAQDLMGALAYDYQEGESWLYQLQPVGDKHLMRMALNSGNIGDMPAVEPTLRMAYDALKDADAAIKRVIIISDGDPQPPSSGLIKGLSEAKIAVSTVCIAPHRPNDQQMLHAIADRTGGKFYYVTNPNNLPQIFAKEAAVVKRALFWEKPFVPQINHDSELLRGFSEAFPQLGGYVVTTPKDNATLPLLSSEGDPILAHWRYGLGKSVAFTSDVTPRWAAQWINWEGFNRFWAQSVRWVTRELSSTNFRVDTRIQDGMGYVRVDAVDDQGKFINFLRPQAVVSGPAPQFARTDLSLIQTGPGIYEGRFPVSDKGIYMVNIAYSQPGGGEGMITGGLALDYSREYEYNHTNRALLEQLVETGGGRMLSAIDNPFRHDLKVSPNITSIWQFLVILGACLFPIEIFVRRVVINFAAAFAWIGALARRMPGLRRLLPSPRLRPKPITGSYGGMSRPARTMTFTASTMTLPGGGASPDDGSQPLPPGAHLPEEAPAGLEAHAPGHTEYTRQLLAAKQRALESRTRRGKKGSDKENT